MIELAVVLNLARQGDPVAVEVLREFFLHRLRTANAEHLIEMAEEVLLDTVECN